MPEEEPPKQLKFPCDCISSTPTCEEPWARVAKEGMFKDGTKELILNELNRMPKTIAQLSKSTNLAQPTVYRHVNELLGYKLISKDEITNKTYVVERYYKLNFPVVSSEDGNKFKKDVEAISEELAQTLYKHFPKLKEQFQSTTTAEAGWSYEEFAQYLFHTIQRKTRQKLERKGLLKTELKEADLDFILWANE